MTYIIRSRLKLYREKLLYRDCITENLKIVHAKNPIVSTFLPFPHLKYSNIIHLKIFPIKFKNNKRK